jgi:hypothetical protein
MGTADLGGRGLLTGEVWGLLIGKYGN